MADQKFTGFNRYSASVFLAGFISCVAPAGFDWWSAGRVEAQTCTPMTATPGVTEIDPPRILGSSCTVEDGGYVTRTLVLGQPTPKVIIHGRAVATGHCTMRLQSGQQCTVTYDRDRGLNAISVHLNSPTNPEPAAPNSLNPIYNVPSNAIYQEINSTDTTHSTGPKQLNLVDFGAYAVHEEGFVFTTQCIIGPGSTGRKTTRFSVLDCGPNWQKTATDKIRHLPSGVTIKLNAAASLQTPQPLVTLGQVG